MKFPKIIKVFKIRINYKSGIQEVIKMREFEISGDFSKVKWVTLSQKHRIIALGIDNIESVYQLGWSYAIIWK